MNKFIVIDSSVDESQTRIRSRQHGSIWRGPPVLDTRLYVALCSSVGVSYDTNIRRFLANLHS